MPASGSILIVDDEPDLRDALAAFLRSRKHDVAAVGSGAECIAAVGQRRYDLVLLDLNMTPMNGFETLEAIRGDTPHTYVCMLTAKDDPATRKRASHLGADGFIGKTLRDPDGMNQKVHDFLAEAQRRVSAAFHRPGEYNLVGGSPAMTRVYDRIRRAAPHTTTILVLGDTGTGKELVAGALHRESPRADKPFVAVNCAALAETLLESELFGHVKGAFSGADKPKMGKYEAAHGGTLFLDEIAKSSLAFQSKLLRMLETRKVMRVGATEETEYDVRVVVAGSTGLPDAVAAGQFLPDLYYRINVFPIVLPPLRDRVEDIAPLVHHFLTQLVGPNGRAPRVPASVVARFEAHTWPGNIRELRNLVERALLLTDGKELADPFDAEAPALARVAADPSADLFQLPFKEAQQKFEQRYLEDLLRRHNGNRRQAADAAGIDPSTLFRKLGRAE